jgi:hypothetical protein
LLPAGTCEPAAGQAREPGVGEMRVPDRSGRYTRFDLGAVLRRDAGEALGFVPQRQQDRPPRPLPLCILRPTGDCRNPTSRQLSASPDRTADGVLVLLKSSNPIEIVVHFRFFGAPAGACKKVRIGSPPSPPPHRGAPACWFAIGERHCRRRQTGALLKIVPLRERCRSRGARLLCRTQAAAWRRSIDTRQPIRVKQVHASSDRATFEVTKTRFR